MNRNNQLPRGPFQLRPFTEQDWQDFAAIMDVHDQQQAENALRTSNMAAPAAASTSSAITTTNNNSTPTVAAPHNTLDEETKEEQVPVPPASSSPTIVPVTAPVPVPMLVAMPALMPMPQAVPMAAIIPAPHVLLGTPPNDDYWPLREAWWNKPMSNTFKNAVIGNDLDFLSHDHLIFEYPEPADDGTPSLDLLTKEYIDAMNFPRPPIGIFDYEGGPSALGMTAKNGNLEFARRLLQLRADPNKTFVEDGMTEGHRTTLEIAVLYDNYEVAELLLQNNADPNRRYYGIGYALLMKTVDPVGMWHEDMPRPFPFSFQGQSRAHFAPLLVAYGAKVEYPGLICQYVTQERGEHLFKDKMRYFQALRTAGVPEIYLML